MPTVLTWCFVWFLHSLWVWLVRRMFGKYLIVLFSFYHDSFLHLTLSFGNVPQIVIFKSQTLSKIPLILFLSPTQHHSSSVSPCSVTGGPVLFSSLSIFGPIFSSLSVSSLSQCFSHFPVLQIISECVKYPPGEADAVSLSSKVPSHRLQLPAVCTWATAAFGAWPGPLSPRILNQVVWSTEEVELSSLENIQSLLFHITYTVKVSASFSAF